MNSNDETTFDYTGTIFPYKELCDEYFGSNSVNISFKRYVKHSDDDSFSLIDITPNDQLYLLTEGLGKKKDLLERLNSELLNTQEFVNSIYMDDTADSDNGKRLPGSKYFAKLKSDFMDGYENGRTPAYPLLYAQVTRRFKGFDIYIGGENLSGFRQKNVILGDVMPDGMVNPWTMNFDASAVWGPLMGAKIYAGIRVTLWKKN